MLKLNLFPLWIPFFFPFEVISAKFRRLSRSHRVWNPGSSAGKDSACNAGDLGSIPELGRSPREGIGYLLQYSCLENPHGQGSLVGCTWGCKESDMTEQLSTAHTGLGEIKCMITVCEKIHSRTEWSREQF